MNCSTRAIQVIVAPEFARYVEASHLRAVARKTLRAENRSAPTALTIVIVSDSAIQDYNRRFHRTAGATDVLSFSSTEKDYLGDIILSYETARDNARRAGWRVRDELELLVVHGVLHLLGYDDRTARAHAHMWNRQADILNKEIR